MKIEFITILVKIFLHSQVGDGGQRDVSIHTTL